jgi:uncharacterized protein
MHTQQASYTGFNALLLLVLLFATSCNFNNVFLQPTKAPVDAKKLTIGTTVVYFSGDTRQPIFTDGNKDTIELNYTIESVMFESANGNKLNGWFLKPKNNKAEITLLHFHGNAGFLLSQYKAVAPLIKNGFQIFMFDYSGFGFSEGEATRKNVLIDANAALDYIKSREEIKGTKLVIYGQSLGGHLSAVVANQRQSEIDGLVMEGAFSSHKDIAAHAIPILGRILVKQGYNATKAIEQFRKPVLIIHSTEDKDVPFFMGKKLFEHANQPKEFFEIKHCHICGPTYYADDISGKIKAMLVVE